MTLSELIAQVRAKNPGLPPHAVDAAVRRVFAEIASTLAERGRVELRGFGSFSIRLQRQRAIIDPRSGEAVDERTTTRVYFRPSKLVTEALNND
jgi:integration host factor subunit beta